MKATSSVNHLRDVLFFSIFHTGIHYLEPINERREGTQAECSHTNLQCLKDMAIGLLFQFTYCYQKHRL